MTDDGHLRVDYERIRSGVPVRFHVYDVMTSVSALFEGPTDNPIGMSITRDGKLLATHSWRNLDPEGNNVFLWSLSGKSAIAAFKNGSRYSNNVAIEFSPDDSALATLAPNPRNVLLWAVDIVTLLGSAPKTELVSFVSAKVVLVGESNVGKSCLATRLVENRYPTDEELGSTLGMRFLQVKPERSTPWRRRRRGREGS